ncbi:hypothetical protein T652_21770 [Klebsiella pneumoniae MRSN 3562]|nr:hypothetical protein WM92_27380 [Klebsiella pneumoniae]KKJ30554.1 hypothetical protein T652_21770 [Klebsiella pneumoniae MRSN 3562]KTH78908.1 hypothetical protein ASV18_24410 [Klebsiella aerogenes]KRR31956.1 hypothetical protein AN412_21580 [Klebsiella pneumoniae]KSY14827.1 hypothetical protein APU00_25325 [Klebsiella pneumoniae]
MIAIARKSSILVLLALQKKSTWTLISVFLLTWIKLLREGYRLFLMIWIFHFRIAKSLMSLERYCLKINMMVFLQMIFQLLQQLTLLKLVD